MNNFIIGQGCVTDSVRVVSQPIGDIAISRVSIGAAIAFDFISCKNNCRLGGGFAKANILISVGLRSAPPNLRLMHYFSCVVPVGCVMP
ncbi:MAG: hypothetical protein V7K97_03840 [Nostoc sp.]|uniref:hypothetical protein n=1 Tax=Nostoc sp. TaxID=1180 RepID=UPI002FF96AC7